MKKAATNAVKTTISTKVSASTKKKVEQEAAQKGVSVSEYVNSILQGDFGEKKKEQDKKIVELQEQLADKDKQIERLTSMVEQSQKLVDQQQELQLLAQRQVEHMQQEKLQLETKENRKWWQVFRT